MYSKRGLAIAILVFQNDVNVNIASVGFRKKFIPKITTILQISPVFQKGIKWDFLKNDFIFWMSHLDRFGLVIFGFRVALLKCSMLKFHTWGTYYKPLDSCLVNQKIWRWEVRHRNLHFMQIPQVMFRYYCF